MTEIDGRSLIAPHPDHPDAECQTCGAPATDWAYPLCTACLIQYSELAAEGEIEQGMAIIRERDERIAELEAALHKLADTYQHVVFEHCDRSALAHVLALEEARRALRTETLDD